MILVAELVVLGVLVKNKHFTRHRITHCGGFLRSYELRTTSVNDFPVRKISSWFGETKDNFLPKQRPLSRSLGKPRFPSQVAEFFVIHLAGFSGARILGPEFFQVIFFGFKGYSACHGLPSFRVVPIFLPTRQNVDSFLRLP